MPQIEEAQFVYWGSMRPDIVPLAAPGVTMAVGPNGSGKSCWLDGLKIILGVRDLSGRRTPASYVFNGGPSGIPAEQAWLRATFANPVHPGQRYRVFAVAGGGCERAEHVTVVCRVRGDRRQYLFLPGRVAWRGDIDAELNELMARFPENRWRGPEQYDDILTRAGVTKALRGVLALPQGETNRLVAERPTGLMKRLLDLTGRQETLDKFRLARTKHDEAVIAHRDAQRRFELKKIDVERLRIQVHQHKDWTRDKTRLADIDEVLLPAARHFEADDAVATVKEQIASKERERDRLQQGADALRHKHDEMKRDLDRLAEDLPAAEQRREELEKDLSEAHRMYGRARERAGHAWRELDAALGEAGALSISEVEEQVAVAESALAAAVHARQELGAHEERSRVDRERVRRGGTMAPLEVSAFRDRLRAAGVNATIVGDLLEGASRGADHAGHAQAALSDAVWGVLVPAGQYRHACERAVEAGFTWPIVCGSDGAPRGALNITTSSELRGLLECLDAAIAADMSEVEQLNTAGRHATTADGMRHGPTVSRLTPVRDPVLHPDARTLTVTRLDTTASQAREQFEKIDAEIPALRSRLVTAYTLRDTVRRLEAKRQAFRTECSDLAGIWFRRCSLKAEHSTASEYERDLLGRIGKARAEVDAQDDKASSKQSDADKANAELDTLNKKRIASELDLAKHPLPAGYTAADTVRLEPVADLGNERKRLEGALADIARYPLDVRDPIIVNQYQAEQDRLTSVNDLITDKSREMEDRARLVEAARRSYDDHIRALVRELRSRFAEICVIAGIAGDIRLIPGDVPGEHGVDVLVSHKAGEDPVSYQDDSHSGGQGTKIAILLLLAAMSLGRTADLLIVDEHKAHLDGTNSNQITEIMRNLSTKVQFVLSAPTNAKDADAETDWCDVQVTFLPRDPGAAFSPPVRLMSRLDASQLEERFQSLQQPLV